MQAPGRPGPITIRADGHEVAPLLRAVAKLFPLDSYTDCPVKMMAPVPGDELDPSIETRFGEAVEAEQVSSGGRKQGGLIPCLTYDAVWGYFLANSNRKVCMSTPRALSAESCVW